MKNANATSQFNMQAVADAALLEGMDDSALLNAMLDEIVEETLPADAADPVIESTLEPAVDASGGVAIDDDEAIEAAIADIEKIESVQALYADDSAPSAALSEADAPKTESDTVEAEGAAAPKDKKEKKAKEPKEPRVTFVAHKRSEVLAAKLGDKASEFLLLEVEDAALEPEALQAKQAELLKLLDTRPGTSETGSTQKKVAEKIVMLFGWMKNGGKLNEVMARTFAVLARDGEITPGDKGNLHAELLAKPYSVGTCRAQAGQMMAMLPMLKIANRDGKKLVANPNSLILMKAKADLGL